MRRVPTPLGLVLIALLLAAVLLLSLPDKLYWHRVVQNAGHGAVFASIAVLLLLIRPGHPVTQQRSLRQYLGAFGLATALGIATELLQRYLPERHVSGLDVLNDAAGAALGLAAVAWLDRRAAATPTTHGAAPAATVAAVALVAFVVLGWEPFQCLRAYAERHRAFPTLAPSGAHADAEFVAARNATLAREALPPAWRRPGEPPALKLAFTAGSRPALELVEAKPDWRGYSVLALDLTNPGPHPARFTLRVLDRQHDWSHADRLNLPLTIAPATRTTVRVPLSAIAAAPERRELDLAAVANVLLFAPQPLAGEAFYVSRVWLEDQAGGRASASRIRRQSHASAVTGGRSGASCLGATGTMRAPSCSATTNAKTNQGVWPMRKSVITSCVASPLACRTP